MGKKSKKGDFTWQFGQPIHVEDKKEIPGVRSEFKGECLDEQIDRIVDPSLSVKDLLDCLPGTIRVESIILTLTIAKGTELVWHAYYSDGKNSYFCSSQPTLRLTLFRLLEELTEAAKKESVKKKNPDYEGITDKSFTWEFGQPITREQKKKHPEFKGECLDEQVDRITEGASVVDLLSDLPRRIKYSGSDSMRLKIEKGSSGFIWYAGYYLYIDLNGWNLQETCVEKVTCPDLRLALYMLKQKISKYIKDESN